MESVKKPKPSVSPSSKAEGKSSFFGVQAKLSVNKPGDQYEVEADRMAETVVNKPKTAVGSFSPSTSAVQLKEEEPVVQQKPLADSVTPYIQRKEEEVQAKEDEEVQAKEEEPAQMKEEESVQAKEEEIQAKEEEEPVQAKEEEVQAKEDEEAQAKEEEPAQMKEEESVQAKEEEIQAKEEEELVQAKEEEIQAKEEEPVQAKEEEIQAKEEEPAQAKEEEVQAKEEEPAQMKEEESVQAKEEEVQAKEEEIQAREELQPSAPAPAITDSLRSSKGAGSGLAAPVKTEMESGFGADFSGVKIHTDSRAVSMNKEIGAQAFTNKSDIYFNEGKFNPASEKGKTLLAHELTHTIQQGAATPKAGAQADAGKTESEKTEPGKSAADKSADPKTGQDQQEEQVVGGSAAAQPAAGSSVAASAGSVESTKIPGAVDVPDKGAPVTAADLAKEAAEGAAAEGEEEIAEEPSIERDPFANPAFKQVVGGVKTETKEQADHEPADELSADAQEAAVSPSNERESIAQANQVEEMDEQEPQEFSAANFKAMLMKRIDEMQLPTNNDQADKFDKNNNIDEVNQKAVGDVNKEKDAAAGPIEQSKDKAPNTGAVPARQAEVLKQPEKGAKPGNVGATKAIPDARPESEVSKPLQEDAAEMDTKMAENNVTDHQLEISQEPKFQEGLASKNTAKANTETAPAALRTQEQGVLNKNAAKADKNSQNQLEGMNALRNSAVTQVVGNQKATGSKDTTERERIAGEINGIYDTTKTDVTKILDDLEGTVTRMFEMGSTLAKQKFENYVALEMARYKSERYSGASGALAWGYDLFAGLPDEVNQFFVDGREVFVKKMDEVITLIAEVVAKELNRAKQRIEQGKQDVNDYVESLPTNLKKFGKEAAEEIQDKFADLQNDVNSKQESLVDSLAQEYVSSLEEVDARIEEMKAANRGLIDMAMDFINGIIDTINKLIELINSLLSAIASVINVIMADPIGFMETLFDGIAQGIDLFKANIQKHLLGGLLEWLTGSLGPMGIVIPDDIFSLSGIFSLVLQVLGLGWDMLRAKSVKVMGEPVVNALETGADAGFTVFQVVKTKGIAGIWEFIQDKFTDLKETIIDAIKDMLITQVIEAGIKWLLSLLIPGAGFIKAIMAIKDVIVFFVESAIMLIPALIEAIMALAAGSVAGVAKAIEFGLARLIPLVIGLLANLIGLGGLSKKVMKIFKKIRKRVDKVINKMLAKAKKAGRKLLRKLGIGGKGKKKRKKETDQEIKESGNIAPETFNMGSEGHTLSMKDGVVYMASEKDALGIKIRKAQKEAKKEPATAFGGKQPQVVKWLGRLNKGLTKVKGKLDDAIASKDDKKIRKAQKKLRSLADDIAAFGNKFNLIDLWFTATQENEDTPKGIFKNHKGEVHSGAVSIVEQAVGKIEVDEAKKEKGGVTSWNGLKNKIEKTSPADAIHEKPITAPGAYKTAVLKQINEAIDNALPAGATPAEKDVARDKVFKIEGTGSLALVSLRNQILDNSKKSEADKRLVALLKGEEPLHEMYKITTSDLDFDATTDGKLVVKYKYTIEQDGQQPEERSFKVIIESTGNIITHKVLGKNLGVKDPGRGDTKSVEIPKARESLINAPTNANNQVDAVKNSPDTAGSADQRKGVAGSEYYKKQVDLKTINFNASHLIADWFNGSGYAEALNLVQTSEYYNKKVMGGIEETIEEQLVNKEKDMILHNSNGKYITFNAAVISKWQEITDNKIAGMIKSETAAALKAPDKDQKEDILKRLVIDLGKKVDPKFCQSVQYIVGVVNLKDVDGKIIAKSNLGFNQTITEDTHLKDVLK